MSSPALYREEELVFVLLSPEIRLLAIPLVEINVGLHADQVAVSATDTLDLCQGVHDLLLAIDL